MLSRFNAWKLNGVVHQLLKFYRFATHPDVSVGSGDIFYFLAQHVGWELMVINFESVVLLDIWNKLHFICFIFIIIIFYYLIIRNACKLSYNVAIIAASLNQNILILNIYKNNGTVMWYCFYLYFDLFCNCYLCLPRHMICLFSLERLLLKRLNKYQNKHTLLMFHKWKAYSM